MCVRDDDSSRAYSCEAALYLFKEHVGRSISTPKIICCRKSHAQTCPFFLWENTVKAAYWLLLRFLLSALLASKTHHCMNPEKIQGNQSICCFMRRNTEDSCWCYQTHYITCFRLFSDFLLANSYCIVFDLAFSWCLQEVKFIKFNFSAKSIENFRTWGFVICSYAYLHMWFMWFQSKKMSKGFNVIYNTFLPWPKEWKFLFWGKGKGKPTKEERL